MMSENQLTYEDVKEYEKMFTLTPPFLLERFAKKKTNLVSKFESKAKSFLGNLNENKRKKLDIVLSSEIDDLQAIMAEAHEKSGKKQYKILANPKYKEFIQMNLDEVRKLID